MKETKLYKHVFFDLDQTLWDFKRTSLEVKEELFYKFNISIVNNEIDYQKFKEKYEEINAGLWEMYRNDEIDKYTLNFRRFNDTIAAFNIVDKDLGKQMADYFVHEIGKKTYFFEGALDLLDYLQKKYSLHVITNGFEEVMHERFRRHDLYKHFTTITTSEMAKSMKPHKEIFSFALSAASANANESIMIGDNYDVDIVGAHNAGIDTIWVNTEENIAENCATYTVKNLPEIKTIL